MKHYLKTLEKTIHENWDLKALCDYGGDSFTYGDLATNVEQFRLFFQATGIAKGEKIAICARNSARWAMAFCRSPPIPTVCCSLPTMIYGNGSIPRICPFSRQPSM